jgi:UDPglucose 6-dehydrogenase
VDEVEDELSYRISVVGLGYVGLIHAVGFANLGYRVLGYDVDRVKVEKLRRGSPTIYEPGLEEYLTRALSSGALEFTDNIEDAVLGSDVTFITVGTPSLPDGSVDLSQVASAARGVGRALRLKRGWHLVVVKSTVPPGTTEGLVAGILEEESGMKAFKDFGVASNPEFLREGSALRDFFKPDRVVLGVRDERSRDTLLKLYEPIEAPKIVTTPKVAELAKYASNLFLAVRVSLANEVGVVCKALGVDCYEVLGIVGLDHRIGGHYLRAGLGFGGSCLPKDVRAFIRLAESLGVQARIARAALEVNEEQPRRAVELLEKHMGSLKGRRIGVLGLAFKPGTDDVRESRALDVIRLLLEKGAEVYANDPKALDNARRLLGDKVKLVENPQELVDAVEAVIIATEWSEYENLDYRGKIVVDGRRVEGARRTAKVYEGLCW